MRPRLVQPNIAPLDGVELTPRLFALVIACGAATGLAGGLLMKLLRFTQHLAFGWDDSESFQQAATHTVAARRVEALLAAAVIACAAVWFKRVRRIGDAGVTRAIWLHSGSMPLQGTFVEAVESILVVGLGVSMGREAALKEAGGGLASALSTWLHVNDAERRVLVALSAGAGMAAAYNLPLGGALLGAEVFLGTLSLPILLLAITASGVGTLTSWLLLPVRVTYNTPAYAFHGRDVLWALLAGPAFGLLARGWISAIAWSREHRPHGLWSYASPIAVFACLGLAAIWFPDLLGNGKGLVQASLTTEPALHLMLALLVLKFLLTAACVGTGTPGGLFTPTMSLGALAGGLLGRIWAVWVPGSDAGGYALIGSAAMLAVSTDGAVSALVMVMELTHHAETLMVPIVLATAAAAITARLLGSAGAGESIYTV